jgi:hypothetical protein
VHPGLVGGVKEKEWSGSVLVEWELTTTNLDSTLVKREQGRIEENVTPDDHRRYIVTSPSDIWMTVGPSMAFRAQYRRFSVYTDGDERTSPIRIQIPTSPDPDHPISH